jgi:hypothetical protein
MRLNSFLATILTGTVFATSSRAQDATAEATFTVLTLEGFEIANIYTIDAAYSEKTGRVVPVPFEVQVPIHDDVDLIAEGQPNVGVIKFTFATKAPTETERRFIENVHVMTATLTAHPDADDPMLSRLQGAATMIEQQVFPQAMGGYTDPNWVGVREIALNGLRVAEGIATYTDPVNGRMGIRMLAIPSIASDDAYVVLNNFSLTLVPIDKPDEMAQTLGGRTLSSWTFK